MRRVELEIVITWWLLPPKIISFETVWWAPSTIFILSSFSEVLNFNSLTRLPVSVNENARSHDNAPVLHVLHVLHVFIAFFAFIYSSYDFIKQLVGMWTNVGRLCVCVWWWEDGSVAVCLFDVLHNSCLRSPEKLHTPSSKQLAEFQFSYFWLVMLLLFPPSRHSPAALACRNIIYRNSETNMQSCDSTSCTLCNAQCNTNKHNCLNLYVWTCRTDSRLASHSTHRILWNWELDTRNERAHYYL